MALLTRLKGRFHDMAVSAAGVVDALHTVVKERHAGICEPSVAGFDQKASVVPGHS